MNRQQWLEERKKGIGASDAAAILGLSPYMTNVDLWQIKTGRKEQEDISAKPCVEYGTRAEAYLRGLFALDFPEYEVGYEEFKIVRSPKYPFVTATLDGDLIRRTDSKPGILEIKTTEIRKSTDWDKWSGKIPDQYYVQVLHQLLATGYDFAILKAQIKHLNKSGELAFTTRHYPIERDEVEGEIDYLLEKELKFWNYVQTDTRPALILPEI